MNCKHNTAGQLESTGSTWCWHGNGQWQQPRARALSRWRILHATGLMLAAQAAWAQTSPPYIFDTAPGLSGNQTITDPAGTIRVIGTDATTQENFSSSFSGTINIGAGGAVYKAGTGTFTLSGATIAGGDFYVLQGALAQSSGNTNIGYLALGESASGVGTLNISGGMLNLNAALQVGDFGGTGTVNQSAGDVVLTGATTVPSINIGNQGGTGTYNLSGGTLSFGDGGFIVIGRNTGTYAASTGVLNLSGSGALSITNGGSLFIGDDILDASTPGSGTINQSGGTLTVDNSSSLYLAAAGNGTYNLSGGALQIGGTSLQGSYNGAAGQYSFNLGGGTIQVIGSPLLANVNATLLSGTTSTIDTNGVGAVWSGQFSGEGSLAKAGDGPLTLTAVNGYTGATTIVAGTLALSGAGSIAASSEVIDNGSFEISAASGGVFIQSLSGDGAAALGPNTLTLTNASGNFSGAIGGSGGVTLASGYEVLSGTNTYTGDTAINGGTLQLGDTTHLSASLAGGGGVTIAATGTFGGYGSVAGNVTNLGTLAVANALPALDTGPIGNFRIAGNLANQGVLVLAGPGTGNTLIVGGNYSDPGGSIVLNTALDHFGPIANQQTDRLLIEGNASGTTIVDVQGRVANDIPNVLDSVSPTQTADDGISIVQVAGSSSATAFQLREDYAALGPWRYGLVAYSPGNASATQRVVAGQGGNFWDYRLQVDTVCEKADCGGSGENPPSGPDNPGPGLPTDPTDPGLGGDPSETDDSGHQPARPALVPQMPAYLVAPTALLSSGLTAVSNLHDRLGEVRTSLGEGGTGGELFVRGIEDDMHYRSDITFDGYGFGYHQSLSGVQAGGNLLGQDGDKGQWRIGLALTKTNDQIEPQAPDGQSLLRYGATNMAITGTWLRSDGWYADTVVSRDLYRGTVTTPSIGEAGEPNAHGWTASLEGGRTFVEAHDIAWEPQAQVVWQSISDMGFVDKDGLVVDTRTPDQWTGRLGMRVTRAFVDSDGGSVTSPFARLNYYYASNSHPHTDVSGSVDDADFPFEGGRQGQSTELELGITRSVGARLSMYFDSRYQWRLDGYGAKGWAGSLGLRWRL